MRINSEIGQWPCPIRIYIVKRCKQQSWKDLQARHQQIPQSAECRSTAYYQTLTKIAANLDMYRNFFVMLVLNQIGVVN